MTILNIPTYDIVFDIIYKYTGCNNKKIILTAEQIQNIVLAANQRLVASVARKYVGRGLDMEDLVQEGFIGSIFC